MTYTNFTWTLQNVGTVEVYVTVNGNNVQLDTVQNEYEQYLTVNNEQENELLTYAVQLLGL